MSPVLVIGGPTAAGKTGLALEIASDWQDVQLVSADAMAVYRGMDIGTAKPSKQVRAAFPHACMDVRAPDEDYNVSAFVAEVQRLSDEHERVVVVGGTPFWLRALIAPLARLPPGDAAVRARLEALPDPHAELGLVDPAAAERLHPNDKVRVIRALEVHALSGRPMSELWAEGPRHAPLATEVVWLDQDDLRARIGLRLQLMMAEGYLDEVRGLLAAGFCLDHKPMRSLGYRHLAEHLAGEIPLTEAVRRIERDTWRLARKQRTWARGMGWTPVSAGEGRAVAQRIFGPPDA